MIDSLEEIRRTKMQKIEKKYSFKITDSCDISQLEINQQVSIAGRIIFFRDLGKIVFGKIRDFNGTAQFSLTPDMLSDFLQIKGLLDLGDIIGISGTLYKTNTGELTIQVVNIEILRKALTPLPDKFKGLQNEELKVRLKYLDVVLDQETKNIFIQRFKIISTIKNFLINKDFIEVETPILQPIASGAAANPFKTHHDALDVDLYLRIAPELYLKRLLIAGMTKIFEIGKCFRNEGIDPTHLQEFTMLEFYQSYISYEELQDLAIELLQTIAGQISEDGIINDMDFNRVPKLSYIEFLENYGKIDFNELDNQEYLKDLAHKNHIDIFHCKSHQALVDTIYKHLCVKKVTSPVLVYNYPKSPLAKIYDADPRFSEQFQIILKGQEVVKACLEMNDPDIQAASFYEQKLINNTGDNDIVRTDDDFIGALKYGMPPAGGLGLGIDRIVTILTGAENIREVIMFPPIKQKI